MSLTPTQTRYLRGLAHALKPVIMTGNKGVTEALLKWLRGVDVHDQGETTPCGNRCR